MLGEARVFSKNKRIKEAPEKGGAQQARVQRAAESSPGRKPGVGAAIKSLSPVRGDRKPHAVRRIVDLCRHLRWLIARCFLRRKLANSLLTFAFVLFPFCFVQSQGNDSDYSTFLHTSQRHAAAACSSCHHRNDNSARPTFPGHKDCTGCHLSQFTTPNMPMCSICHTDVSGNNPPLKGFPDRFKESFNVKFDHAQHLTGAARPKSGCTSCHASPLRRGAALSIPANLAAHEQCYACHTPNSQANGRDLASCGVCHDQRPYGRTSTEAAAFRLAFSHAQHSGRQHLGCSDCHNYTAGLPQRRQVSSPRALEHFPTGNNTCATCHNGRRSFGGDLDFKSCRRCHTGQSFRLGN